MGPATKRALDVVAVRVPRVAILDVLGVSEESAPIVALRRPRVNAACDTHLLEVGVDRRCELHDVTELRKELVAQRRL